MKKNKISKNWVNKQRRDIYVRQSKIDGYRARSAYKLMEIDEKFSIFKGGVSVVDIGAAPTAAPTNNFCFFTFLISIIWSLIFKFLCMTPIPPAFAITIAILLSVTVSIADVKIGILNLAAGIWRDGKDMRVNKDIEIEIKTTENQKVLKSLRYIK